MLHVRKSWYVLCFKTITQKEIKYQNFSELLSLTFMLCMVFFTLIMYIFFSMAY